MGTRAIGRLRFMMGKTGSAAIAWSVPDGWVAGVGGRQPETPGLPSSVQPGQPCIETRLTEHWRLAAHESTTVASHCREARVSSGISDPAELPFCDHFRSVFAIA
jgi:hypothetical protein